MQSIKIANRIQEALLSRGIEPNQIRNQMAHAAKVNNQAVAKWFSGETKHLRAEQVALICQQFGLDMQWVTLGEGSPPESTDIDTDIDTDTDTDTDIDTDIDTETSEVINDGGNVLLKGRIAFQK